MAINEEDERIGGPELLQESAEAIAGYMSSVCEPQGREAGDILV